MSICRRLLTPPNAGSSGFYVRQLVHELGEDLGCGAIAYAITRTRQGPFTLRDALTEAQWDRQHIVRAIRSHM